MLDRPGTPAAASNRSPQKQKKPTTPFASADAKVANFRSVLAESAGSRRADGDGVPRGSNKKKKKKKKVCSFVCFGWPAIGSSVDPSQHTDLVVRRAWPRVAP